MNSQVLYFTVLVCLMEISRWSHKNILCSVPSKRTIYFSSLVSHKVTFGGGQPSPIWSSFTLFPILKRYGNKFALVRDPHHCNDYLEHLNSSVGCWCVWYSACLPMVEICLKNSSIISIGCLYFFKSSCVVNIVYFWWSQLCNLCSVRWLFVYSNMAQWYYIVSQWRGYWVTFALV